MTPEERAKKAVPSLLNGAHVLGSPEFVRKQVADAIRAAVADVSEPDLNWVGASQQAAEWLRRAQVAEAQRDRLREALRGLAYDPGNGEPLRFCTHAAEPCARCEAARAALEEQP